MEKRTLVLLIILVTITLLTAGAIIYMMQYNTATPVPTPKITQATPLANVTFYPIDDSLQTYSDQSSKMVRGIGSTCAIVNMDRKTILVTYKNTEGTVQITKGMSPGCPPTVIVKEGIFTPIAQL
ncbi:MAG: hypothetical protein Q7S37_01690 [bacterium]|nr:hypothetical protein [bacterium]